MLYRVLQRLSIKNEYLEPYQGVVRGNVISRDQKVLKLLEDRRAIAPVRPPELSSLVGWDVRADRLKRAGLDTIGFLELEPQQVIDKVAAIPVNLSLLSLENVPGWSLRADRLKKAGIDTARFVQMTPEAVIKATVSDDLKKWESDLVEEWQVEAQLYIDEMTNWNPQCVHDWQDEIWMLLDVEGEAQPRKRR